MFPGFDKDKKLPYSQEVYFEFNGNIYKTTYYVCRGYGDSVSITSEGSVQVRKGQEDERSISKKS